MFQEGTRTERCGKARSCRWAIDFLRPLLPTQRRGADGKVVDSERLKLWQGCGKNPDFAVKADIIDNFLPSGISNLRVCNAGRKIRLTGPSAIFSMSYE